MALYTLYELTPKPVEADIAESANISPFVSIAQCDLALLGVPFKGVALTLGQIRSDLAKETGDNDVTVPTLKAGSGYVTDSWEIAKFLEKHHATPSRSLFNGDEEANHIDDWALSTIAGAMRPLTFAVFCFMQDEAGQEHFMRTKYGGDQAAYEADLAALRDPAQVEKFITNARAALKELEERLGATAGPFLLGSNPGHADSAVYGWYLYGQINAAHCSKMWESDELPRVKAWIGEMKKATGLDMNPKLNVEF